MKKNILIVIVVLICVSVVYGQDNIKKYVSFAAFEQTKAVKKLLNYLEKFDEQETQKFVMIIMHYIFI